MATSGSTFVYCAVACIALFASFGSSQKTSQQSPDNCNNVNTTVSPCSVPELEDRVYCLNNGSFFLVTGFCNAQDIICQHKAGTTLEKDHSACGSSAKSFSTTKNPLHSGSSKATTPEEPAINTGFNGLKKGENSARSSQTSCQVVLAAGFIAIAFFSGLRPLF